MQGSDGGDGISSIDVCELHEQHIKTNIEILKKNIAHSYYFKLPVTSFTFKLSITTSYI
jgi:hypothetical protein